MTGGRRRRDSDVASGGVEVAHPVAQRIGQRVRLSSSVAVSIGRVLGTSAVIIVEKLNEESDNQYYVHCFADAN